MSVPAPTPAVRVLDVDVDGVVPLFPRMVKQAESSNEQPISLADIEVGEDALFYLDGVDSPSGQVLDGSLRELRVPALPELGSAALAVSPFGGECFVARLGAAVLDMVVERRDELFDLVIDEGSSESFRLEARFLAAVLEVFPWEGDAVNDVLGDGELEDQEDADVSSDEVSIGEAVSLWTLPTVGTVTAADLDLPSHWARLDLRHTDDQLKARIRQIVKEQTRTLSDVGALPRQDMRTWLLRTAVQARAADGRDFAVLLARSNEAAAALTVVNYWHPHPPHAMVRSLEAIRDHLVATKQDTDELTLIDREGERVLRRVRHDHGPSELGASEVPLLLIDYWIPTPDDSALAHVAFSTPHTELGEEILNLCDAITLSASWVPEELLSPESAGEANPHTETAEVS